MRDGGTPTPSPGVSVVIPFYQEEPGILRGAARSALNQTIPHRIDVIIVDDGSPIPARQEVADVPTPAGRSVRVIEQANAGPAAARNEALERVDGATEYVAFLDSDDEWKPDHLQVALNALEQGYDLFYADQYIEHEGRTVFQKTGRPDPEDRIGLQGDQVFAYRGNLVDEILSGNMRTSALVYRYARFPHIRFPVQYHYFGEDHTFLLDLTRATHRVAVSSRVTSRYGSGVSIYSETQWGSSKALRQNNHALRFRKSLLERPELNPAQRAATRRKIVELRREFVGLLLHFARHGKKPEWPIVRSQVRADPGLLLSAIPTAVKISLAHSVSTVRRGSQSQPSTEG